MRSALELRKRAVVRCPLLALGVGLAALCVLLIVIPDIFIPDTSLGWVDAWYYVGFARKLPEMLARYHQLYQSERIAWTAPAYVFIRIAPPLVANYLVKGAFFVATIVFLFGSTREITGSVRTAAFVSGLAAFHSFLIHSLGTSYVDGPMNTYVLGTIYFSTRAFLRPRRIIDAFLAGVFVGCQLFAHLIALVLIPSLAVWCWLTWAQAETPGRNLPVTIGALVAGTVSVLAAVMALYAHWGPDTFPLRESFRFSAEPSSPFIVASNKSWVAHASWLVLPTAVAAWAVIAVVSELWTSWSAPLRLPPSFWLLLGVYFCWIALYFRNQPWLMLPFYSSYLIPPTFVALAPLAAKSVDALSAKLYAALVATLFVGSGMAYWLSGPQMVEVAMVVALTCLAGATWLRLRVHWHASPAFPILLVASAVAFNYATADYNVQFRNGFAQTGMRAFYPPSNGNGEEQGSRAERFSAAIAAAERLDHHLSGNSGRWYFFWYDGRDDLGMFYRSMTSLLFAWSTSRLLGEDFHDFDLQNRRKLADYSESWMRDLVILTRREQITPPDSRFRVAWTDRERVGETEYFVHYLAFQAAPMPHKS